MARRSRRVSRRGRDVSFIANQRLPRVVSSPFVVEPGLEREFDFRVTPAVVDLRSIEDRRRWHPERALRPALSFSGLAARTDVLVDRRPSRKAIAAGFKFQPLQTKAILGFREPDRVLVCVRRQARKEVLHALGKAGRGGGRRGRRGWSSGISCRRS